MYSEIFYHNFFINFLTALLFIIFNFYFSYSVSNIFNKNILFKENNPLLVFFLVFLFYASTFNYLILFKLETIIKVIFFIILFLQIFFIIKIKQKIRLEFIKKINKKNLKKNLFFIVIFFGFFLISILPLTDADSIASHLNFATKLFYNSTFPNDLPKDIEFVSYGNSEILLLISTFLPSDNFGSQLNFFTLIFFLIFFFKDNKIFFYLILSCPLIIFFISTQKLQLFYGLLYLYIFILILNKKSFNKFQILSICFLIAFYASGKMNYILLAVPLFIFFLIKHLKNFKEVFFCSVLAFFIVLFPILLNKFIYFSNPLAPFADNIIGQNNFIFNIYSDSLRSSEGWLRDKRLVVFLKPFFPVSLAEISASLGLFFFLIFDKNLLVKVKYFPLIITILILITGQALPRYYFEAFLILIFFTKFKNNFYTKVMYLQIIPVVFFTFSFIYLAYIQNVVLINKDKYLSKFSYTYYNSKKINELNIDKNILNLAHARESIYLKNNHFGMRFLAGVRAYGNEANYQKYFIKFINNYNIDYIIGTETDVPNCIKIKKINEISFKTARRNFLLKQNIVNSNLFLIVNKECK